MKNKLFYLIGVACLLSYTGTFTSCVNGVDDEYLDQKITEDNGGSQEGEEIPDINGDYGKGGDYEVIMTCNGEELTGKLVSVATDKSNETATLIFSGTEVDIETPIASAIPGGVGGLISGMGLKYTSNSPIPGIKEITIPNVPLYKNGTTYKFDGDSNQPTYTIAYKGTIEGDKMTIDLNYKSTNQKLAGIWYTAKMSQSGAITNHAPFGVNWDSNIQLDLGKVNGMAIKGTPNTIFGTLDGMFTSATIMEAIIGTILR